MAKALSPWKNDELVTEDPLLYRYLQLFRLAWDSAQPYFRRANEDCSIFEQEIDPLTYPTISQVTLGQAKAMVDQALPPVMSYLFGAQTPVNLYPADERISYDTARNMRDWLMHVIRDVMRIESRGMLAIKDAIKIGCGYNIIEPKMITPPISSMKMVMGRGVDERARQMEMGKPVMIPACTFVPFGQVIPTPDGSNPNEVTCVFVLRFLREDQIRQMLNKKNNPDSPFSGNAEEIIQYARESRFNGYFMSARQIAAQISGKPMTVTQSMNRSTTNTPVSVPILECYAKNEHVWFACDQFKIFHVKESFQTLRCPVIKATFDPDGDTWYTPGIIRPNKRLMYGIETMYNAVLDILSSILHPHQLINVESLVNEGQVPTLEPWGHSFVTGDATKAVSYVYPPPLTAQIFEVGQNLRTFSARLAGQPEALQGQGTAGLVRGGAGAMETLFQSSSGREKLQSKNLENGWFLDAIETTMALMQGMTTEDQKLKTVEIDQTGKRSFVNTTITTEDIRHVYAVELDFKEKMRNPVAEQGMRAAIYDRGAQNKFVNPLENYRMLVDDDRKFKQLTSGTNPDENMADMQAIAGVEPGVAGGGLPGAAIPEMAEAAGAGVSPGGVGA